MVITITKNELVGKRIDLALLNYDEGFSRSQIQKAIKNKKILINDKEIKPNYIVKFGDVIKYDLTNDISLEGENIPINIVYEDNDLIVINKNRGLVVHPGNGNHSHTLVNALIYKFNNLSNVDPLRPGIVHRIDKDTSGLLIIAKNNNVHRLLSEELKKHNIKRTYMALVSGVISEDEGKIIAPISRDKNNPLKMCVDIKNGKEAESDFKVKKRFNNATLVEVNLKQGRTHQIRVHFNYINHPLIGDLTYGRGNTNIIKDGQILHAYKLKFKHPITKKILTFTTELPKYFSDAVKIYKNIN